MNNDQCRAFSLKQPLIFLNILGFFEFYHRIIGSSGTWVILCICCGFKLISGRVHLTDWSVSRTMDCLFLEQRIEPLVERSHRSNFFTVLLRHWNSCPHPLMNPPEIRVRFYVRFWRDLSLCASEVGISGTTSDLVRCGECLPGDMVRLQHSLTNMRPSQT